jgi:hypothetical protein
VKVLSCLHPVQTKLLAESGRNPHFGLSVYAVFDC